MGRGGARPNAGRKKKFEDSGQKEWTRSVAIPADIPKQWINEALTLYLDCIEKGVDPKEALKMVRDALL